MTDGTITTAAKGDSEPAMPRPDGGPEPLNRRVEIQITIGL
jgi:outer membrane protein OmpA-like peptidoglycan-associated protein